MECLRPLNRYHGNSGMTDKCHKHSTMTQDSFYPCIYCYSYNLYSVENVTGILMEIPCHLMSQMDGSFLKIDTKFHDDSVSFIQVLFAFHDIDFGQVEVMEFPWHMVKK